MNYLLYGYRGSGKSSTSVELAQQLGLPVVDTDDLICEKYGMVIKDIWSQFGEAHFRETECDITENVLKADKQIISLGGGTVIQDRAFKAVQAARETGAATSFYLDCSPEILAQRIAGDQSTNDQRPSLSQVAGPADEVREVLNARRPRYQAAADYCIQTDAMPPSEVAAKIAEIIRKNNL